MTDFKCVLSDLNYMKGLCGLHFRLYYLLEDTTDVMHQFYRRPGPATSLVWSSSIASNHVKSSGRGSSFTNSPNRFRTAEPI